MTNYIHHGNFTRLRMTVILDPFPPLCPGFDPGIERGRKGFGNNNIRIHTDICLPELLITQFKLVNVEIFVVAIYKAVLSNGIIIVFRR